MLAKEKYTLEEIEGVNSLLLRLLGDDFSIIVNGNLELQGENILRKGKNEILKLLKNIEADRFLILFKILNYYYPRWIAYIAISESDSEYKEFASNNELIIALTSIIDFLANGNRYKRGWTKRFIAFLEKNSKKREVNEIIKKMKIQERGVKRNLVDLNDLACYIYKIRSLVVHYAELGGIWPWYRTLDYDEEHNLMGSTIMFHPKEFRRLLWKSIFIHLGLKIII